MKTKSNMTVNKPKELDWEKEFDEEFKSLANEYCDPTNDVKDFISKTLQQQREEGNEDSFWRGYKAGMYKMSKNGTCSELVPNTNKTIKVYIEDEIEPKLQNLKQENK